MNRFPQAGQPFGRYQILGRIGHGGMGTVFEARQVDLDRSVALKLLSPELAADPSFRTRFEREARTVANLDSPHVIQVYDYGEIDGELYIATQLIHGRDLRRLLEDEGALDQEPALQLLAQIASALADAHEAGILHRDVKPANILVRESPQGLYGYLCDFGIARQPDSTLTRTSGVIGTLNYMAPECHEGHQATAASDVYSLGCVLWAALSGEAPYDGTSEYQVAQAHLVAPVPQLAGTSARIHAVNEILLRAMAKSPEDRYRSARELGNDLLAAVSQRGATVASPGTVLRPHSSSDTRLRPIPDRPSTLPLPRANKVPTEPSRGRPPARSRRGVIVASIAAVAAVLVLIGVAFAATHLGQAPDDGHRAGVAPASKGTHAAGVVCGDGSSAPSVSSCPLPHGSHSMRTVFPSLDGACQGINPNPIATNEIRPVFRCVYGGFEIRYSTWAAHAVQGRREYFAHAYGLPDPDAPRTSETVVAWEQDDTLKSRAVDAGKPYFWAATYVGRPYSVIVKAASKEDLDRGIAHVRMTPQDEVPQP